jgi:CRISPR-associated protein Csb2
MASDFWISVRFLQPYSHGRGEDGRPEWPPSPLRLFQSLVAVSIGRMCEGQRLTRMIDALRWMERLAAPEIVAPRKISETSPYRMFVPDNIGDKVAKSWAAGRKASLADYRTEKDVRAAHLADGALRYVFRGTSGGDPHLPLIQHAARSLTHLGWGVDQVVGDAGISDEEGTALEQERWVPDRRGGPLLRCPIEGTLDALQHHHVRFLGRLEGGTFRPVPSLAAFVARPYARPTDAVAAPAAAFRLISLGGQSRLAFDSATRARDVAAWLRHAVAEVAEVWPFGDTAMIVHGHSSGSEAANSRRRFSYLPLPTIARWDHDRARRDTNQIDGASQRARTDVLRIGGIARAIVTAPVGCEGEILWLAKALAGGELIWRGKAMGYLEPLPAGDWVLNQYTMASDVWSTVTPVVLPGHDDRAEPKAERLLLKAFAQAGFDPEIVSAIKELDWRGPGFLQGTDHATRYVLPDKVKGPRFHVRVRFGQPIAGPIAVGSGRHRGMGVFARTY